MHTRNKLPLALSLPLAAGLSVVAFAPAIAIAGPGDTDAKAAKLDASTPKAEGAELAKAKFLIGEDGLRVRKMRHHVGKRATQFEVQVAAPSYAALPHAPGKLTVSGQSTDAKAAKKGDPVTENLSLNFAQVQIRYAESRPAPSSPTTATVTAIRKDARGRKLGTASCKLSLEPGASCQTADGDEFAVYASPISGEIVVEYAHLVPVAAASRKSTKMEKTPEVRDAAIELKMKASAKLAPDSMTRTFWTATATANRPHHRTLDHVGTYNFMVEISGVNAGYFKAAADLDRQVGEILIDGVVFEIE